MKKIYVYLLIPALFTISCKQRDSPKNIPQEEVYPENATEFVDTSGPDIKNIAFSDTIRLAVSQNMVFDNDLFRIKSGKKIVLILKNTEAKSTMSMLHNVVILNQGTDIVDFGEESNKAKQDDYIPTKFASSIIAHTNLIRGQESDTITFTIPTAGVYDFICSYPGHWGTMQGRIVVE